MVGGKVAVTAANVNRYEHLFKYFTGVLKSEGADKLQGSLDWGGSGADLPSNISREGFLAQRTCCKLGRAPIRTISTGSQKRRFAGYPFATVAGTELPFPSRRRGAFFDPP
jgi:hypothetical protein